MLRSRIALCLLTGLVMVVSGSGVAPGVVPSAISQPAAIAIAESEADVPWLRTDGSEIVTPSGDDFTIRAVNWFGMETSNCAPHGLWQISLDQAMDQMASFGFNTIRLPYSSECLAGTAAAVSGVDGRLNPRLPGLTPLQIMDRVVDAAAARNLRVLLDRHRPDSGSQSELWYTERFSEQRWIDDWVSLASRYANSSTVIGADLHNEPHGPACWGCGDPAVDWAAAATRAGDAVLAANPHWLVVVEGVERQQTGGSTWWGGGLADVAGHPITLAVPHQLVYSAHDYPASIYPQSWFADPAYPANLPSLWDRNWGYLQQQNIAPVLMGEFGTKLGTDSDAAWLTALVSYLETNRMSFAYWSYNPNSGDTGGLVADDWRTPQQAKLDDLAPLLTDGADPPPVPAPPPSRTVPPADTETPSATTAPTPGASQTVSPTPAPDSSTPSTAAGSGVTASWQLQSSWPDGYVAQLVVTAPVGAIDQWTVSWPDQHARSISNAWGMTCDLALGVVRCQGADWASRFSAGGSVTVGVQVAGDGNAPAAPVLTVG
jgi:endoglucanase